MNRSTLPLLSLFTILVTGCTRKAPAETDMQPSLTLAEQFGQAVVRGDFESAHQLLTDEVKRTHSPVSLKAEVADMISYAKEPLKRAVVMANASMTDGPDKQSNDLAWIYVALEGDSFSEAVSVVVTKTSDGPRIRELEWGRP